MGGFIKKFLSEDNKEVNSPTIIAAFITLALTALAIPVTVLGMCAVYHHVWTLKKGLDSSVTTLLLGLAGGGGMGCGIGYGMTKFGKSPGPPPGWKPPPLGKEK